MPNWPDVNPATGLTFRLTARLYMRKESRKSLIVAFQGDLARLMVDTCHI